MTDIRKLMQAAAGTSTSPNAEEVTRAVTHRATRIRFTRVATAAVAAILVLVAAGLGATYLTDDHTPPAPPADSTTALPTDHAVGAGTRIDPRCGGVRKGCTLLLTTRDGRRYVLPGPRPVDAANVQGVGLSPDGKWLMYHRSGGEAVIRDLLSTTTRRVPGARDLGGPKAWSANDRWVLVQSIAREQRGITSDLNSLIRVDLATGREVTFSLTRLFGSAARQPRVGWAPQVSVLPNGQVAFPIAGAAPTSKPTRHGVTVLGSGTYRLADPGTGRVVGDRPVRGSVAWTCMTRSQGNGTLTTTWQGRGPAPLLALPDGSRAVISNAIGAGDRTRIVGFVDLTTGAEHTVDVTHLLAGTKLRGAEAWSLEGYDRSAITFLALDDNGVAVGQVRLSPDAKHVVSTQAIAAGHDTLLPGSIPPM